MCNNVIMWNNLVTFLWNICDALRDLVSFGQLKKREKHSCRSVTFSKVSD